ncbi:MAG: competence protein ComEC, partial [Microbacterium sp.]
MRSAGRPADLRLLPVAAVVWTATGAAVLAPDAAGWIAVSAAAIGVAILAISARRGATTWGALLTVGLAFAGAGAAQVAVAQPTRAHVAHLATGDGRAV